MGIGQKKDMCKEVGIAEGRRRQCGGGAVGYSKGVGDGSEYDTA